MSNVEATAILPSKPSLSLWDTLDDETDLHREKKARIIESSSSSKVYPGTPPGLGPNDQLVTSMVALQQATMAALQQMQTQQAEFMRMVTSTMGKPKVVDEAAKRSTENEDELMQKSIAEMVRVIQQLGRKFEKSQKPSYVPRSWKSNARRRQN